jgi:hypothetical protein
LCLSLCVVYWSSSLHFPIIANVVSILVCPLPNYSCVKALCYNLLYNFFSWHISMLHFNVAMVPICLGLLPYVCRLFAFVFSLACVYLSFFFAFYFWWMSSYPWFLYIKCFSICNKFDVQKTFDKFFFLILLFFCCYIVCLFYNSPLMPYSLLLLLIALILKFLQEMGTKINVAMFLRHDPISFSN